MSNIREEIFYLYFSVFNEISYQNKIAYHAISGTRNEIKHYEFQTIDIYLRVDTSVTGHVIFLYF